MERRLLTRQLARLALPIIVILGCVGGTALGWAATASGALPGWPLQVQPTPATAGAASTRANTTSTTELEAQIEAVYQRLGPSVVNITSRSLDYDFFLNPVPREGTGSGFFFDRDGHIVTNYHVIEGAEELQVALAD